MPFELAIDPVTGDIAFDDGEPVTTDSPATSLYLAIAIPRGSFHGDPELGSELPAMVSGGTPPIDQEAALEAAARSAVQRLADHGVVAIEAIDVQGTTITIHSTELAAPYTVEIR